MGSPLLHVGATVMCSHAGPAQVSPGSSRVKLSGQPLAISTDTWMVAGCPFMVGTVSQPCVQIKWSQPSSRVSSEGKPVLLSSSGGVGYGATQAPQGPANVATTQVKVLGS